MGLTIFAWIVVALATIGFALFFTAIKMRRARVEAKQNDDAHAMQEDAYRLAKAKLIYRRKRKQESEEDPLKTAFGVEVPTHLRSD